MLRSKNLQLIFQNNAFGARLRTPAIWAILALPILMLPGCGKAAEETAAAKSEPSAAPVTSAQKALNGEVVLGPDAPELKEMVIEPVQNVQVAVDEVIATARIQ